MKSRDPGAAGLVLGIVRITAAVPRSNNPAIGARVQAARRAWGTGTTLTGSGSGLGANRIPACSRLSEALFERHWPVRPSHTKSPAWLAIGAPGRARLGRFSGRTPGFRPKTSTPITDSFKRVAVSRQRLFHHESPEPDQAFGILEHCARDDPLQLFPSRLRAGIRIWRPLRNRAVTHCNSTITRGIDSPFYAHGHLRRDGQVVSSGRIEGSMEGTFHGHTCCWGKRRRYPIFSGPV